MKKLIPIFLLLLFVFFACEDDDDVSVSECNGAVATHDAALATYNDISSLYDSQGDDFVGSTEYVDVCESLYDLAEYGLAECPEAFAIYAEWTADDFVSIKAACVQYGP